MVSFICSSSVHFENLDILIVRLGPLPTNPDYQHSTIHVRIFNLVVMLIFNVKSNIQPDRYKGAGNIEKSK